jgi:hypothetical protein
MRARRKHNEPSDGRPRDARDETVRKGKDELRLVSSAESRRNDNGLPSKKHQQPQNDVEQERGSHKGTDVDARLRTPDSESCSDVTGKHPASVRKKA